ncbi:ParA family protein [Deinococcus sonorensis]|uniref:ParA family protein n=1 Tax=Deinococcus sonorensis TaxID=309891 RepID=A0ABV8YBU2_9DEIO
MDASSHEVNVRGLRSGIRRILDAARDGQRTRVVSAQQVLGGVVGLADLRTLGVDLTEQAVWRSTPDVRTHLKDVLQSARAGQHTLVTYYGQVQAAVISPAQLLDLERRADRITTVSLDQPLRDALAPAVVGGRTLIAEAGRVVGAVVGLQDLRQLDPFPHPKEHPMTVLTFWNESGGATKSTMVAELGYLLSQRSRPDGELNRVLLIDLDPQRSLTHRMGLLDDPASRARRLGATLSTIMQDSDSDFPEAFTPERMPGLRVIPAHQQMRALDSILISEEELLTGLRDALEQLRGQYDFILIDTPPSNGGLTRAALVASQFAVIPMPTHIKSVENLENVTTVLAQTRRLNPQLKIALFIPTTYNKGRVQDREILELIQTQLTPLAPIAPAITERPAVFRDVIPARGAVALDQPRNPAVAELNAVLDQLLQVVQAPVTQELA